MKVGCQELGGFDHPLYGWGWAREQIRRFFERCGPIALERAPIDLRETLSLTRVGHHDEVPLLSVRLRGCLQRNPQTLLDEFRLDGALQIQPQSNGPSRGKALVAGR